VAFHDLSEEMAVEHGGLSSWEGNASRIPAWEYMEQTNNGLGHWGREAGDTAPPQSSDFSIWLMRLGL